MFLKHCVLVVCLLLAACNGEDQTTAVSDASATSVAENVVSASQPRSVVIENIQVVWQKASALEEQLGSEWSLMSVTFTEVDPKSHAPIASPRLSMKERLSLAEAAIRQAPGCYYHGYDPATNAVEGFMWEELDNIIVVLGEC
ncbi:hypothetical protein SAMN05444141_106338 [Pseudovibrio denitrificans]|uniref:Lipoprotein n=1 Tax=Pseudovibrio denitrificans TaxID=258256 RepID=A0A1I7CRR9_9HYPH|nr:hypothetical protein [Pseudovibrio denitrificans]SFU02073.1 hypothetical protein SAMN05444141_106338 [Pseudovibrio denitrificans]